MNQSFYGFGPTDEEARAFRPTGLVGARAATRLAGATPQGPPVAGTFRTGDVLPSQDGTLRLCTAGGSPGTWRTLAPFRWTAVSANYTVGTADTGILVDATSANVTVTLPSAAGTSQLLAIKRTDSSAHTVSGVTTGGQTIDSVASLALQTAEQVYLLGSDGANWSVVAAFYPSPLTTKADLLVADASALPARLGVGSDAQVLTADSTQALGVKWATPAGGYSDPLTTKGDLVARTASATTRQPGGSNGQVLTADSAQSTGLKWAAPATGTTSPLTTKGDVWGYGSTDARVPVGADGLALVADSTQTLGVRWGAPQPSSLLVLLPNANNFVADGSSDEQPPDFVTLANGDVISVGGM